MRSHIVLAAGLVRVACLTSPILKRVGYVLVAGFASVWTCAHCDAQCNAPCVNTSLTRYPSSPTAPCNLPGTSVCAGMPTPCGNCYDACVQTVTIWGLPAVPTVVCHQPNAAVNCGTINNANTTLRYNCDTTSGGCKCNRAVFAAEVPCPQVPVGTFYTQCDALQIRSTVKRVLALAVCRQRGIM